MSWIDEYFAAWARHAQASDPVTGMADRERLLAFMDPDIRYEDVPTAQVFTGYDGVIAMGAQALLMANDIRFARISAQESGDQFAFESEAQGTNTGAVGGFPATGKSFVLRSVSVGKLTPNGKVISHKDYWDLAGYLTQIGLMPKG
jgi:steroid delta-isomerase-like uncharacterized protein